MCNLSNTSKKVLSLMLSIVLFCTLCVNSFASSQTTDVKDEKIISALQSAEYVKDKMGLSSVNFADFKIGEAINAYDYTNNGFVKTREFYSLVIGDSLTALAIKIGEGNEASYQISTALVSEINSHISNNTEFALIYDANNCYIYSNEGITLIKSFSVLDQNRINLPSDITLLDFDSLQLKSIEKNSLLGYTNKSDKARTAGYYECNVSFVSQNPPSNMCWAASIACIVNSVNSRSLTAEQVARTQFGDAFDQPLYLDWQDDILSKTYGLAYSYKNSVPGDGVIARNIKSGWPIAATLRYSSGYHIGVVFGINIFSGVIYIMDPEAGFCSSTYSSGGYKYVSSYSNVTLTFNSATCRFWTA